MNSKTEERKYELESTKLKLKLLSLASEALTEWTFHSEKNGIQLYVKPTSSSIDIAQVVTRIDKPVDQLATFLFDTAKEYTNPIRYEVIEDLGRYEQIVYLVPPTPSFISGRDFVYYTCVHPKEDDGKIVSTNFSVEHDKYPVNDQYVRAYLLLSGIVYIPVDENTTEVRYFTQVDLNGWLPNYIVNMCHGTAVERIEKMKQIVKEKMKN